MPSILFICTANQYRSPLAAAFFKKELETRGELPGWIVESAGTWAQPDLPAALPAQQAAIKLGVNLGEHLTRPVSEELLSEFDLVLAMEAGQVEAMEAEFPSTFRKIYLLTEVATGVSYDIPDPAKSDVSQTELASEIQHLIQRGYKDILTIAKTAVDKPAYELA